MKMKKQKTEVKSQKSAHTRRYNRLSSVFCHLSSEKGIALVTALLLTLIGLAIILAAIYLVTKGTTISGLFKRYETAREASFGATDFITKEFIPNKIGGTSLATLGNYGGLVAYGIDDACFDKKLKLPTTSWGCGSSSLDPKTSWDMTLTLQAAGGVPFRVYTKIVDTVPGNTSTSGIDLEGLGVVEAGSGIITPQHFPYMYRIEIQGERQNNPDERANLSVLYAY